MITLREVVDAILPTDPAGNVSSTLMEREVTWATRPRPSPPAFGHLSGGELVLLRLEDLTEVDDRLTLDAAIRQLAGFGVSAVAFAGAITSSDRSTAAERDVALFALPPDTDLSEIERRASHVIAERRRDRQRRGHESGRKLMELAISGEPLAEVISTLSNLSHQAIALEGRDGRILTYFGSSVQPSREVVTPLLEATRGAMQNWLAVISDASPAEPPTMHMALSADLDRTIAPVIGRDGLLGCLSLIGPLSSWSGDDALLASRGAAACAIVLAREFASIAARREIELNVLDEVLDGALRNEVTLLQQARRLGHDLLEPHRILICRSTEHDAEVFRPNIATALSQVIGQTLWRIKGNEIEIVLGEGVEPEIVLAALRRHVPGHEFRAGAGSLHAGLANLQRSSHEARQAVIINARLGLDAPIAYFGDLGIFRLLFAAEGLPEFDEFHADTLGTIVEHDLRHRSDYVATLRAFFDANGSPKDAAARMGVHRNTVLYRLDRISDLTGYNLADAETRLRLQLALSINTIKFSESNGRMSGTALASPGSA